MAWKLPWRRRSEGFEWHKYVRTTIALRREARREKVADLGRSAAEGARGAVLSAAGGASGAARSAAGLSVRLVGWSRMLVGRAIGGIGALAVATGGRIVPLLSPGAERLGSAAQAARDVLARRGVQGPLLLAAAVALATAVARAFRAGRIDREALVIGAIGGLCLLCALLPRLAAIRRRLPGIPHLGVARRVFGGWPRNWRMGAGVVGVVAVVGAVVLWGRAGTVGLPSLSLSSLVPFSGSGAPVTGIADVIGADRLRIGTLAFRLDGVDAPEPAQVCSGPGSRRWRCAERAEQALRRMAASRKVTCVTSGAPVDGVAKARCHLGTLDLAARLVGDGVVFADTGMLAAYSSQQEQARQAKRGMWAAATPPERPAAYRARSWSEAATKAPGGCPIKGVLEGRGREKTYHLPWSQGYARHRVRSQRGERWLCSEDEARTAGFRSAAVRP